MSDLRNHFTLAIVSPRRHALFFDPTPLPPSKWYIVRAVLAELGLCVLLALGMTLFAFGFILFFRIVAGG